MRVRMNNRECEGKREKKLEKIIKDAMPTKDVSERERNAYIFHKDYFPSQMERMFLWCILLSCNKIDSSLTECFVASFFIGEC
jgi:hypothetical protein